MSGPKRAFTNYVLTNKDVPLMPSPFYAWVKPVFAVLRQNEIRRPTRVYKAPGNTEQVNVDHTLFFFLREWQPGETLLRRLLSWHYDVAWQVPSKALGPERREK